MTLRSVAIDSAALKRILVQNPDGWRLMRANMAIRDVTLSTGHSRQWIWAERGSIRFQFHHLSLWAVGREKKG